MRILTLGAGSWGAAMAVHLASMDHKVSIWDINNTAIILRCQAFYQISYLSNTLAFIIRRIQVYFSIIISFLYVNNKQ